MLMEKCFHVTLLIYNDIFGISGVFAMAGLIIYHLNSGEMN